MIAFRLFSTIICVVFVVQNQGISAENDTGRTGGGAGSAAEASQEAGQTADSGPVSADRKTASSHSRSVKLSVPDATLVVPEGFVFLGPEDGRVVLKTSGRKPPEAEGRLAGVVVGGGQGGDANQPWSIAVRYAAIGYVPGEAMVRLIGGAHPQPSANTPVEEGRDLRSEASGSGARRDWILPPRYDEGNRSFLWAELRMRRETPGRFTMKSAFWDAGE